MEERDRMKLWIGNIAPGTSDDELREFLKKYGVDSVAAIERVDGDGSRPAAVVEVAATPDALMKVTQRMNGMFWKGRTLVVQTTTPR
jgi:RNA recognition motif-containing protein